MKNIDVHPIIMAIRDCLKKQSIEMMQVSNVFFIDKEKAEEKKVHFFEIKGSFSAWEVIVSEKIKEICDFFLKRLPEGQDVKKIEFLIIPHASITEAWLQKTLFMSSNIVYYDISAICEYRKTDNFMNLTMAYRINENCKEAVIDFDKVHLHVAPLEDI